MNVFFSEALAAVNAIRELPVDSLTSTEMYQWFYGIIATGILCGAAAYYSKSKGKTMSVFLFMGHMFMCSTAGLLMFLGMYASGNITFIGAKEEVRKGLAWTAFGVGAICLIGPDAIRILMAFMKDNLLSLLERILDVFKFGKK